MATCPVQALVDRHFEAANSPDDERRLREHLPTCASCAERYERRMVLSQLVPGAPSAQERMASGLGFSTSRPGPSRFRWWLLAAAPVAAALALLVNEHTSDEQGFAARGRDAGVLAPIEIYRVPGQGAPSRVDRTVASGDALAFAYRNPAGRRYLAICGVDGAGEVRWFAPAWTEPSVIPNAVPAAPGHELHELKEAVAHALPAGPLRVHAYFLDRPLPVNVLERMAIDGGLPEPEAEHVVIELEVRP